jgi:hypothetical protein
MGQAMDFNHPVSSCDEPPLLGKEGSRIGFRVVILLFIHTSKQKNKNSKKPTNNKIECKKAPLLA